MSVPEGCPCDAVVEIKENLKSLQALVTDHDRQLGQGEKNFALIQKDLDYIKNTLDRKTKFNAGVVSSITNGIITIILGYIAIRLGLQ